jgi:Zn-dependent M28 family amino/carboxypeptidase
MLVRQSTPLRRRAADTELAKWLKETVVSLSVPRHAHAEEAQNRRTADRLAIALESCGLQVIEQGPHRNIVALPRTGGPITLVCAHYDSVPYTPGADDNASALAVMLGVARSKPPNIGFVAFNREEDGMLGSSDFVVWMQERRLDLVGVHVLEMLGYTDPRPGSQRLPEFLPNWLLPRDTGDFIAVVGLGAGHRLANQVRTVANNTLGVPPVVSLQAPAALLGWAPDLGRSDHLPFVQGGLPAVMWTDTAEFRTPHYHQLTDTPDTLDYRFMAEVQTLLLRVLAG